MRQNTGKKRKYDTIAKKKQNTGSHKNVSTRTMVLALFSLSNINRKAPGMLGTTNKTLQRSRG
jgi:hypothetical protein